MKKLITTLLIFCAFTYSAFSGPKFSYIIEKSIQGVILDGISGNPLVGASIQIKNTTRGTTTDAAGKFSITVPDNGAVPSGLIIKIALCRILWLIRMPR